MAIQGPASYSSAAAFTFQVWEQLICLADDVRLVYRKPFTLHKANFVFLRVAPLIVQGVLLRQRILSQFDLLVIFRACQWWAALRVISLSVIVAAAQVTQIARVVALYGRSRRVLYGLTAFFVFELLVMIGTLAYFFISMHKLGNTCNFNTISDITWAFLASAFPAFILDCILLGLTLYKLFTVAREARGRPLFKLVIQSSIGMFIIAWTTVFAGIILMLTGHIYEVVDTVDWIVAIFPFASCRIFLSMAKYSARREHTPAVEFSETYSSAARIPMTTMIPYESGAFTLQHPQPFTTFNSTFKDTTTLSS